MSTLATAPISEVAPIASGKRRCGLVECRHSVRLAWLPLIIVTFAVVVMAFQLRWSLASGLTWQCDELPLLQRFTGLRGHATSEAEAVEFQPSLYSFRMGAMRSLRAPKYISALHTTTGFWANLTIHLFGYGPAGGRAGPLTWSMLAVGIAAWGAWMITRSIPAACLASWMVALSPHAVAYAAQARGYAEAMALAPLLLILLEYFRRRPERWFRGVLVLLCAVQLSLTVYTLWIYWVFPVVVLSVFALPRMCPQGADRGHGRSMLILLAAGLCLFMGVYTIDRWRQLTFTASHMGVPLEHPGEYLPFLEGLAAHLLPRPVGLMLLAAAGVWIVRRGGYRWWLWMIGAGVLVPAVFSVANGSPGYPRNFGYLLVPVAILFATGADGVLRVLARRVRPALIAVILGALMIPTSAWAYSGLQQRARAILLPDWGELVLELNRRPETIGTRWLCPCLANHWQISWYQRKPDYDDFMALPLGGQFELIMGAQLDQNGRPKVFRIDPTDASIAEEVLPDYLATITPQETRHGIEVRRWSAVRVTPETAALTEHATPVFVIARSLDVPTSQQWVQFLANIGAHARSAVTFHHVTCTTGSLHSMIVPASAVQVVGKRISADLAINHADVRFFSLNRL